MKISIVTPSFNQGKFIWGCLESVLHQRGLQIEHIILDNCSTDSTAQVLERYKVECGDVDVKIIVEKDGGQTPAINRGFSMATGDIVCWLNTDEYYADGALREIVDFFEKNPDVDVLFGDCVFVDETGAVVKRKREFGFSEAMLLHYGCYIPSCSTFFRRRVIEAGHFLDDRFRVAMDLEYYARLANLGYRFGHVKSFIASFTWHETNISRQQNARRLKEVREVKVLYSLRMLPVGMRRILFGPLFLYWLAYRVVRRAIYRMGIGRHHSRESFGNA